MAGFGNIIKRDAINQQEADKQAQTTEEVVVEEVKVEEPVVVEEAPQVEVPEVKVELTPIGADALQTTPPPVPAQPRFENGRELADVNVVDFVDVTLKFGDFVLFDKLNFNIPDFKHEGQFISIIGRSGSGKSQCARLISGLSKPTDGEVRIYGVAVDEKTRVPMVFQQYSSFPWMKVIDNVALPMKLKGVSKKERKQRAIELLNLVGLETEGEERQDIKWARYPALSGGQLQRVSLARNLAADSQIMILDEATSALDIFSKRDMQQALLNIYYDAEYDPTIINITHDISEAVMLSNRIIILQSNPSKVYKVVDIEFEGRRTQDIRNTEKFNEYVKQIESIMDEVAKR